MSVGWSEVGDASGLGRRTLSLSKARGKLNVGRLALDDMRLGGRLDGRAKGLMASNQTRRLASSAASSTTRNGASRADDDRPAVAGRAAASDALRSSDSDASDELLTDDDSDLRFALILATNPPTPSSAVRAARDLRRVKPDRPSRRSSIP